jgi:hypothetical protein
MIATFCYCQCQLHAANPSSQNYTSMLNNTALDPQFNVLGAQWFSILEVAGSLLDPFL